MQFWKWTTRSFKKLARENIDRYDLLEATPEMIDQLAQLNADVAIDYLCVCCESHNGYTREAALNALQRFDCPQAMPAVLTRLSDWVPEVRGAAQSLLQQLIEQGHAAELVVHHKLVDRLLLKQRVDLTETVDYIRNAIRSPDTNAALMHGLKAQDVVMRRFCFITIAEDSACHKLVIDRALADPDPSVRRWLAREIVHGRIAADHDVVRRLMFDPAPIVGTTIIRSFDLERAKSEQDDLILLATHKAKRTREAAQYWISKAGQFDLRSHVRGLIQSPGSLSPTAGAVACLGEVGRGEDDYACVSRWVESKNTALRRASVQAVASLTDDADGLEHLFRALGDSNSHIRSDAADALMNRPRHLWLPAVKQLYLNGDRKESNQAGIMLVSKPDWDVLPTFLKALRSSECWLADAAYIGVCSWADKDRRYSWLRPDKQRWDALLEAWAQLGSHEPPSWAAHGWEYLASRVQLGLKEGWHSGKSI